MTAGQNIVSEPKLPVFQTNAPPLKRAISDLLKGLQLAPMWLPITFQGILSQRRRLFLGIAWIPLGMLVFAFIMGYVYSWLRGYEYLPFAFYIFAGYMCWQYISACISGSASLFTRNSSTITNAQLPYSYYIYEHVLSQAITIGFSFPFFIVAKLIMSPVVWDGFYLIIPAALIYLAAGAATTMFLSVVFVRFRDLETPLLTVVRIMFLFTPIIWRLEQKLGSKKAAFVEYNPFYHFVEIMRAPLLGEPVAWNSWAITTIITVILAILGFIAFFRARARIAYWL